MPEFVTAQLPRRSLTATAVVAACLLMAACGGSSRPRPFPGGIKPIGPADVGANVSGLMATHQPFLKHIKAKCPKGPVTKFPVLCTFTAIQAEPLPGSSKRVRKSFPGPYRVNGSIKIFGVYFRTRTYEYSLNYVPTH